MRRLMFIAIATILAAPAPALATGELQSMITPADQTRLDGYGAVRKEAIDEARKGGSPSEVAILDGILRKPAQSFAGFDMTGAWQCRTIKAGNLSPLVVYGWFRCRVTDDGSGWRLQKLTGSQRTTGRFFDDGDKRLVYLGSGSVNDDRPPPYGSGPESDQVGYAFRTGAREWRIEFPSPHNESKLDILELRR
ncbi:MAG: DUF4893 domain-containing protein [Rhizobiaceae bacterium]|nr:DUF4893 domain-containing protein [Rhizobiaceae bacterium]